MSEAPVKMVEKYNRSWPATLYPFAIELECYRWALDTGLRPWEHLKNAVQLCFPNEFKWSYWCDLIFRARCDNDFLTIWGAGGTGKSTTCAMWDLMDWSAAPMETMTKIFTTSMGKQNLRHFGEVTKFHGMRRGILPGEYVPSEAGIFFRDASGVYPKAAILAQSVKVDGNGKVAEIGNYGVHNIRNRMVIDEANGTPAAALKSADNQSKGGESFKLAMLGNPSDPEDLLCINSVPQSGSFDEIDPDTMNEWETYKNGVRLGTCIYLDGLKSPRLVEKDGETKFRFLIGKNGIDYTLAQHGKDSAVWWEQVRGFLPKTQRVTDRIFDVQVVRSSKCREKRTLYGEVIRLASLDPAWSSGGDECVLKLGRLGYDELERRILVQDERHVIRIRDSASDPVSDQVARQVDPLAREYGCPRTNFGIDITGTQHGIADVLQLNYGWSPYRISFGGGASTLPISAIDKTPANERYFNRVSEMWFRCADSLRYGSIFGIDEQTITELMARRFIVQGRKKMAESKKEMKARMGRSPDNADTTVMLDTVARELYGFAPENNVKVPEHTPRQFERRDRADAAPLEESFQVENLT